MSKYRVRWSDHDKNFGPFTFASERRGFQLGLVLDTGDMEDGAYVRLHLYRWTFLCLLPSLLRAGRQYGVTYQDGALHLRYGRQTWDSATEQSSCVFLPWMQRRHVRHSLYGLTGKHLITFVPRSVDFPFELRIRDLVPAASFTFEDFDGEQLVATTRIEEREWRLGTGWFRWLSWFRRPFVQRSLEIEFSGETGRRKGSWKGGTIGHGIEMKPGELHEAAFRRYCDEHEMRFVGAIDAAQFVEADLAEGGGDGR